MIFCLCSNDLKIKEFENENDILNKLKWNFENKKNLELFITSQATKWDKKMISFTPNILYVHSRL